ncbi:RmlC-like cupin domain protein [Acididesulfobacillus acetoxydans]|uniref:RmlC-like cupin domain protein n=1 Tax=Acididesulfobacillus acetoxydans TaxID=1561005 RepID=A0A8S0WWS1_9FIRM|nr:RmlC-like cupin domain protein [Acididesulfobacillus acetoxydans]CEJ06615.1 Transcriptional regulator, XRE [Acididesulfobacillus acetoxydans]
MTWRIGQILKNLRKQKQLTLDRLAEMTGVSKPMLSQIERGETNPTVVTLWKIATGLAVPFSTFLQDMEDPGITLVRASEQRVVVDDEGEYVVRSIMAFKGPQPADLFHVRLEQDCSHRAESHGTGVTEGVWIRRGRLTLNIDGRVYELEQGDSLCFFANAEHTYINRGGCGCEFLVVLIYSGEGSHPAP